MAAETNPKVPPVTPKAPPPPLPQKPASKATWLTSEGETMTDTLKIPEHRPHVIVFVRTPGGYMKALEIDRDGDSLFGTGEVARNFTEILSEAISKKITVECKPGPAQLSREDSESLRMIKAYTEERKWIDGVSGTLFCASLGVATLFGLIYLVISRIRDR